MRLNDEGVFSTTSIAPSTSSLRLFLQVFFSCRTHSLYTLILPYFLSKVEPPFVLGLAVSLVSLCFFLGVVYISSPYPLNLHGS